MQTPEALLAAIEGYLEELALTPELGGLTEPMRYALAGGGPAPGPSSTRRRPFSPATGCSPRRRGSHSRIRRPRSRGSSSRRPSG